MPREMRWDAQSRWTDVRLTIPLQPGAQEAPTGVAQPGPSGQDVLAEASAESRLGVSQERLPLEFKPFEKVLESAGIESKRQLLRQVKPDLQYIQFYVNFLFEVRFFFSVKYPSLV